MHALWDDIYLFVNLNFFFSYIGVKRNEEDKTFQEILSGQSLFENLKIVYEGLKDTLNYQNHYGKDNNYHYFWSVFGMSNG